MSWKHDEYRFLKPVAEFSDLLLSALAPFIARPVKWAEAITESHQKQCLERLKQEISQCVLQFVRGDLLDEEHPQWQEAADLRGPGTTFDRRRLILRVINASAPELTGENAGRFKDAIKAIIENAIAACGRLPGK